MTSRAILILVANPSVSSTLGWPVGFWASELIHPYDHLTKAGHQVTIASLTGGRVIPDGYSDPRDASGYAKDDSLSRDYLERPEFVARLADTPAISTLNPGDYDALIVAGGQSPMFTFRGQPVLQEFFLAFLHAGKPTAALCHGTCLLLDLKNADGTPLIRGRRITGFANSEEDYADRAMGAKVMPFRIEDEARVLGANFITAGAFEPFAVQDGNLITGQQQNSGQRVAELVIAALAESRPKLAFIGIGQVGSALAGNLVRQGYRVVVAARDPNSAAVRTAVLRTPALQVKPAAEAVAGAMIVFLATPFAANAQALAGLDLTGKILIDCTNPVGPGLAHGLASQRSGAEEVQRLAPGARVVKAFTIYGYENFEDSSYPGYGALRPAMLTAGDDDAAKTAVAKLCVALGWEPVDCGPLSSALHLEHLTLLWIKRARMGGAGAGFVWAKLQR